MKSIVQVAQENAVFRLRLREREVLIDKLFDPEDPLEMVARPFMGEKLSVFALQLAYKGAGEDEIEGLVRRLVSLEKLNIIDLSRFLDLIMRRVGNLHDPVLVIGAIAENVNRFQPDGNHAVVMAGALVEEFAALADPQKEKELASTLKGN